ncbi:MAG: hypothetical protein IPL86_15035 [Flavobacteriales bacterium]|nr:hypothetical protein [Flavobacteriales bacterium]
MGKIIWDKRNPKGDATTIGSQHEYIQIAAKDKDAGQLQAGWIRRKKENAEKVIMRAEQSLKQTKEDDVKSKFSKWLNGTEFSGGEAGPVNQNDAGNDLSCKVFGLAK